MPKSTSFSRHHRRYDGWFVRHAAAYHSELLAVRALLPLRGLGLSIGVGTGRFAGPLGVRIGLDPAREVLEYASQRGILVVQGAAEALPFPNHSFDYALSVTTICFVDDAAAMLSEAYRVLKPGGRLVTGFIDRTSGLGRHYRAHQAESEFYREATFYASAEVEQLLCDIGFKNLTWVQTLSGKPGEAREIEPLRTGYGQGAFVVVGANRR
ncbi:MAG: class I SAM-dependent methyltransferase [Desulfobacterales bacterium]